MNSSGIANINKTGISEFSARSTHDAANTIPTEGTSDGENRGLLEFYAADYNGGSNAPKLTVTTLNLTPASVDWDNSNVQDITLSTDRSLSFANARSGGFYTMLIKQDGTGGRAVTWPSNVKWPNGTAPALTGTANSIDMIKFIYDGTSYLGYMTILNMK